jgi:hypothetical protein
MADTTAETIASDDSCELPPIRIHHFLAWTAVMSVMLALSGSPTLKLGTIPTPPAAQTFIIACRVVGTILGSLAVTIALFGLYWHCRGLPFPVQPGQWLIVEIAAMLLFGRVMQGTFQVLSTLGLISLQSSSHSLLSYLIWLCSIAVGVALCIYIGRKKVYAQEWRRVFYCKAFGHAMPFLGELAVALMLQRAVRADQRAHPLSRVFVSGARNHWTDRAGIILQFLLILIMCVGYAAGACMMAYLITHR